MQIKKVSLSDCFSYLLASFRLIVDNPARFALASVVSLLALIVLFVAVTTVFTLFVGQGALMNAQGHVNPGSILGFYGIILFVAVVLMPPFMSGWLVYCQKIANANAASVGDLFTGYSDAAFWGKLIRFSAMAILLFLLINIVYIGLFLALGFDVGAFDQVAKAQLSGDPNALALLPGSFWLMYAGLLLLGSILQTMLLLGFAELTLGLRGAGDALKAGVMGTLKNVLVITLFILIVMVLAMLALLVFAIVASIFGMILAFISPKLMLAVAALLYVVMLLYIYPMMFTFSYYLWLGILGEISEETPSNSGVLL